MNFFRNPRAHSRDAFTLIEIMIVAGIAALVMSMSVPFVWSALKKDPMRQATSDVAEACSHARARAIFSGSPTELVFRPQERTLSIQAAPAATGIAPGGDGGASVPSAPSLSARAQNFSARISDDVFIEELAVNFLPYKDAEEVRVRFYPNGTSDEFTIILNYRAWQLRKITLDVITGLADIDSDPKRWR
ncbi:MAG: prepilin-type N-terminal cleavage/methylation domain-containing protein [Verrucomicrobia bacterium]|nr:prepilin-type N-terminal cleavage/methylation domain-containing protein [Verrucomicrobiota bacterium]